MTRKHVLLTGATGRIGPYVLRDLLDRGCRVRVATPDAPMQGGSVEWVKVDFSNCHDSIYAALVVGVDYVIHLAAELNDPGKMNIVNVDSAGKLAQAAELAGVKRFVYSSSVGVYGFPWVSEIDELTPVLPLESCLDYTYTAEPFLLEYSLTKLRGEMAIKAALKCTELVILRFSNVLTEKQLDELIDLPLITKLWRANRNCHQIYAGDVSAAVLYSCMDIPVSSTPEVMVVSEDHTCKNTYSEYFKQIPGLGWKITLVEKVAFLVKFVDRMKDRLKYRSWRIGLPAGQVRYVPYKLMRSGFVHPLGIKKLQEKVLLARFGCSRARDADDIERH